MVICFFLFENIIGLRDYCLLFDYLLAVVYGLSMPYSRPSDNFLYPYVESAAIGVRRSTYGTRMCAQPYTWVHLCTHNIRPNSSNTESGQVKRGDFNTHFDYLIKKKKIIIIYITQQ